MYENVIRKPIALYANQNLIFKNQIVNEKITISPKMNS